MTRLETLSPQLTNKLRLASTAKLRAASLAASEFAVFHATIEHPVVERTLENVRRSRILTPMERAEVDALAEKLEEEYFTLLEAAENGQVAVSDRVRLFTQARAVAALSFAGAESTFEAASEAIYEASATTDDHGELLAIIEAALE